MGAGDRQPVSAQPDRDGRHRQRDRPRRTSGFAEYEDFIQTDAAINPGQLGRRADQHARRAGRHQHRHLQPERRLSGHRLRRAEQPRPARSSTTCMKYRRGAARHDRRHRHDRQAHAADRARNSARRTHWARSSSGCPRASAAYDAGIRPGDVIVGFNGTQVDDPSQLYRARRRRAHRIDGHRQGASQRPIAGLQSADRVRRARAPVNSPLSSQSSLRSLNRFSVLCGQFTNLPPRSGNTRRRGRAHRPWCRRRADASRLR